MSVQNAFKHNRDRKAALAGGMVIMICITLLSCVSSFMIYREGFRDIPEIFMNILSLFAVMNARASSPITSRAYCLPP